MCLCVQILQLFDLISFQTFGSCVLRVLNHLSKRDPSGYHCMSRYLERRGWVFRFQQCTFFVTTFAPCYPSEHPRYGFESESCFLLFQPEVSFAQHDLPPDTALTNWDQPKTVRDRIRVAFREDGREYMIRQNATVTYPMVWEIVRPVDKWCNFFRWWDEGAGDNKEGQSLSDKEGESPSDKEETVSL